MDASDHSPCGSSNLGYTVDTYNLAQRVGELRAVSSTVADLANSLNLSGYDIGPDVLPSAVAEFADELRSSLAELDDKIDVIAGNVSGAVDSYEAIEQTTADQLIELADERTAEAVVNGLQGQAVTLVAEQEAVVAPTRAVEPGMAKER